MHKLEGLTLVGQRTYAVGVTGLRGLRLTWVPEVDSKIRNRCFKYWSRVWPDKLEGGSLVWQKYLGSNLLYRISYDGAFTFEIYRRWLDKKKLGGLYLTPQNLEALLTKSQLRAMVMDVFREKALFLLNTFDFLPRSTEEQVTIAWTQLQLFNTREQLIDLLLKGGTKPLDSDKISRFLDTLEPMQVALINKYSK